MWKCVTAFGAEKINYRYTDKIYKCILLTKKIFLLL